jgi:hypothetical protein
LQNLVQQVEADVDVDYSGRDVDLMAEKRDAAIANAMAESIKSLPAPVINVNMPEHSARSKRVERDEDGNITAIVEE